MTVTPCATRAKLPDTQPLDTPSTEVPSTEVRHTRRRRRIWTSVVAIVALAAIVVTLRGRLPSVHAIGAALAGANLRWVGLAGALEALSLSMFARQQRSLLRAVSVRMSLPRALAVTYARSAITISMPAGSALSAGFAFQQYRRSGASREHATAVIILSGVVSVLGLAALYLTGTASFLVDEPVVAWRDDSGVIIGTAVAACVLASIWLVNRRRTEALEPGPVPDEPGHTGGRVQVWFATVRTTVREAIRAWRSLRPRHWTVALGYSVANWLTDLLCLTCVARAFGLPVSLVSLASIYLGVQLLRQIPITPGGIGLIETGLLAGLTSAGAPAAAAAAVVLTYRILSCWLILPIGGLAWLGLRLRTPDVAAG